MKNLTFVVTAVEHSDSEKVTAVTQMTFGDSHFATEKALDGELKVKLLRKLADRVDECLEIAEAGFKI